MDEEENELWKYCKNKMKNEGFHYCFIHYSNFAEIKDEEFHRLRNQYINSAKELEKYINDKANTEI